MRNLIARWIRRTPHTTLVEAAAAVKVTDQLQEALADNARLRALAEHDGTWRLVAENTDLRTRLAAAQTAYAGGPGKPTYAQLEASHQALADAEDRWRDELTELGHQLATTRTERDHARSQQRPGRQWLPGSTGLAETRPHKNDHESEDAR